MTRSRRKFKWLKQLRTELLKRAALLDPPYRAFSEMRLKYWFRDIDKCVAQFQAKSKAPIKSPRQAAAASKPGSPSKSPRTPTIKRKPTPK